MINYNDVDEINNCYDDDDDDDDNDDEDNEMLDKGGWPETSWRARGTLPSCSRPSDPFFALFYILCTFYTVFTLFYTSYFTILRCLHSLHCFPVRLETLYWIVLQFSQAQYNAVC